MKKRIIQLLRTLLLLALPAGTLVLLGFASQSNRAHPCREFRIRVDHSGGSQFVTTEDLRRAVTLELDSLEGRKIGPGALSRIREVVLSNPFVDRAAVYRTIGGDLHVEVSQREPILRVVNSRNQGYYLDRGGRMMPLSPAYAARVPVATGHIAASYSPDTRLSDAEGPAGPKGQEHVLRELYRLARHIDGDNFWSAFIDQVYVTPAGEFELIPKNGAHTIEFGSTEDMEEKFEKLLFFYRNGLSRVGWGYYRRVNVKYAKQVVCSK
jgi:cell division protein FtsQ